MSDVSCTTDLQLIRAIANLCNGCRDGGDDDNIDADDGEY